jgi:hypothetical protein
MAPLYSPVAFAGATLAAAEVCAHVTPHSRVGLLTAAQGRAYGQLPACISDAAWLCSAVSPIENMCPQITRVDSVRVPSRVGMGAGAGPTYVLEVQGPLHPLMVHRMARVLAVAQARDLTIAAVDAPGSVGLNAILAADQDKGPARYIA